MVENGQLGGWWRRISFGITDLDSIFTNLFNFEIFSICRDIAVEVYRSLELIEKLTSDVVDIDKTFCTFMFRYDTTSISCYLSYSKTEIDEEIKIVVFGEAREVRSCCVGTAFDSMTSNECSSKLIVTCI